MKSEKLILGILAHVDAGKTTLAESILYLSGAIRNLGRVDHKNAFLDTFELERSRGITIFSKQAEFMLRDLPVTLLDTPGHVDFSAEMERTLQVLDYAILVINGMDGVQGHVKTLWRLLKRYQIPVFLFINKMDQPGTDKNNIMQQLHRDLDGACIEFNDPEAVTFFESLAMCDEQVMEEYLEQGRIEETAVTGLIKQCKVFPCYFGSALKLDGVEALLDGLSRYTKRAVYPDEFGAKVFKISRDGQGTRLTHLKITGGMLKVKMMMTGINNKNETWEEKIDQIRVYSGAQYQSVSALSAGMICAVTGLSHTYAGECFGSAKSAIKPMLEPVLTYRLCLPPDSDFHKMYLDMCQLEEEDPQLHVVWDSQAKEIQVQVMGEIQIEVLKSIIADRFHTKVEFSAGSILYKETIANTVEGIGHFEPLRHYAEVHLLLEPAPRGSGISYELDCSEDQLDRNWQHLVLTHLQEKRHLGVLTGAEITDLKITLAAGKGHQKHTEGGDFRQATYRAVRQGLKKAESILLEPYYEFTLEIPADKVGRAMADIQRMSGTFDAPVLDGGGAVITGSAPVSQMRDYQIEVIAYTKGEGRLFCRLSGYQRCHNEEEVIARIGYDPEADIENPTGSVFCSHGAGFIVPWNQVEEYMHLESVLSYQEEEAKSSNKTEDRAALERTIHYDDNELEAIFVRTYGPVKARSFYEPVRTGSVKKEKEYVFKKKERIEEYLLVDGYNIIFAWNELKELSKVNIAAARDQLCEILCNYQGYKKNTVIVVFDAYKVDGGNRDIQTYKNIYLVYTEKAETADQYIERTVKEIGRKYQVTVATSDAMEQMIIWGLGAMRMSAREFKEEIEATNHEIRQEYLGNETKLGNRVIDEGDLNEIYFDESQ